MKKYNITSFHPLYYIFLLVLISPIYSMLNQSTAGAVDVTIGLDAHIPFLKEWVVPYLLWYPFIYGMLIYLCFAERKLYYEALSSILIGKMISFIIYFFWQSTVPRPEVVGNDFFAHVMRFVYSADQPVNCLPSIHVLTTFVIMMVVFQCKKQHKLMYSIVTIFGSLIILSTLFTKQHAILDATAGMLLAFFVLTGVQLVTSKIHLFNFNSLKAKSAKKLKAVKDE
ncbi:phosphatase PAP2 family protein [Bacillus massiliigorillae]|uniref:phosphatase PAP2 family protein n=1 Tax=Bacillus massiliigorillae TaxID=1243664 RepID=UPI0005A78398|nr:phosphatase PAP2 family protein [Bacillus massiliigorillae]